MNKVIYIHAHYKAIGKMVKVKVPTGETREGWFGGEKPVYETKEEWQQTGWSDCLVDGKRLSTDIAAAVESLNREGYEVVSLSPVISGAYNYEYQSQGITSSPRIFRETEEISGGGSYGYGYGFSYSEGVTVIARKTA